MKKILITGAMGRVGAALVKLLDCRKYEVLATDISEVDVTNEDDVYRYISLTHPDVIINCAGMTDVEECEKNVEQAYKVNAIGARNLAVEAQNIDAKLIQISTDDVFDYKSEVPYNEFDTTHPKTIYGKSKYAGECMVSGLMTRYVIIRSSWIYGTGIDFVSHVLSSVGKEKKLEVPNNKYASPTSAKELAKIIIKFIENNKYGLYHAVCKGSCSRYDFAKEILRLSGKINKIELCPVIESEGKRPDYSVLDNLMLRISDIPEPIEWRTALAEYIKEIGADK